MHNAHCTRTVFLVSTSYLSVLYTLDREWLLILCFVKTIVFVQPLFTLTKCHLNIQRYAAGQVRHSQIRQQICGPLKCRQLFWLRCMEEILNSALTLI